MAELVDAHDSKSCVFGRVGSIPTPGTRNASNTLMELGAFFFGEWREARGEWRVMSGEWRVASCELRVEMPRQLSVAVVA